MSRVFVFFLNHGQGFVESGAFVPGATELHPPEQSWQFQLSFANNFDKNQLAVDFPCVCTALSPRRGNSRGGGCRRREWLGLPFIDRCTSVVLLVRAGTGFSFGTFGQQNKFYF